MATAARTGSAQFTFTSIAGMTSPFLLALPLNLISDWRVQQPEQRWVWRSMDRTGRNVVAVESLRADILTVIRMDDQGDRLRDFLRYAMDGSLANLTYKPTSVHAGVAVDIDEVAGGTGVQLQVDRSGIGWEAAIRLVIATASIGDIL